MQKYFSVHPEDYLTMDTPQLRDRFVVPKLFVEGELNMAYFYDDRMVLVGVCPGGSSLSLPTDKELASEFFLQRREIGIINIGGEGRIVADGVSYTLAPRAGLYLGCGVRSVEFHSTSASNPAKFYGVSAPADKNHPAKFLPPGDISGLALGSQENSNKRSLNKYFGIPSCPSCRLVMGMTILEAGSVWNSMPPHTHTRRSEVYCYFGFPPEARVFHMMGRPRHTRQLVLSNEDIVLSPPWSIHCGVGTQSYAFIWAMSGENQEFTDADTLTAADLL